MSEPMGSYVARVRIRVRAGGAVVVREGTGLGSVAASKPAEAHERALKAAETDATKRTLATFGSRFGLGLYDKDQNGVTAKKPTSGRRKLQDTDFANPREACLPTTFLLRASARGCAN